MKSKSVLLFITGLCFFASLAQAQVKNLKVLVLYDMEGVSGIYNVKQTDYIYKKEYEEARKSLTDDVNAAIAGLKTSGATEIIIVDGHGSGNSGSPDVYEDQLLAPAKMISRTSSFDIYMDSYDQSIDAIVAIGMHAGAGNRTGFISHTYTMEDVEYKVNGMPYNESMILAMGATRYRIPLIMVSGDDQLQKEVERMMPWVRCAVVKYAVDRTLAKTIDRAEVSKRIEKAAAEAVQNLKSMRCPDWTGPFRFALKFQDTKQARTASWFSGAELLMDGLTVQVRVNDFEEGYSASKRLMNLASLNDKIDAMTAIMKGQKNGSELEILYNDRLIDRWMEKNPEESFATVPVIKYWGAR